jgi:hypothetical protein
MAASTTVTAGAPGNFDDDVPASLVVLVALGALGATAAWTVGQFVNLGAGTAYWDGGKWVAGKVPAAPVAPVAPAATAGDYVGTTIAWTTPPTRYLRRERHKPHRRTAR